ncbi:glycine cleavage system protein R [Marinimicrobium sp. ABcell2]|uniref:glycine cleavage system protein R n=1 Tax=Marinimicrobium sp. ABcell2 TaxID=3069751 RepID=UPI0027B531DD|nr:ACT domain-containing protein [Marinimicrobium sp. ABcell2]MDQ2075236.1 ACT domain-containing protein [Marinimicrobium sp. ABcell2]
MNNYLVLTIISDDKPGLVETLAQTISEHGGNWLESRMAHLAGKFAGILQVAVAPEQQEPLTQALNALSGRGLKIVVEATRSIDKPASQIFNFSVIGPDRTGIVHEIARAFAARHINMDELETDYSSMPWSGEPLFEATGIIEVPEAVNMDELHNQLDTIADELALDIRLEAPAQQV